MFYTAIDFHKRYSVAYTTDAAGTRVKEARIDNSPEAFASYFRTLPETHRVVIEACWNWAWLHDVLEEIDSIDRVILANPGKTRIIADAQIKTDRLDAKALCTLLRGDLIAEAHAPSYATRAKKHVLRQRVYWVRVRTQLRNRIHVILDRQRDLDTPVCTDLFGQKGLTWLRQLELPDPDGALLKQSLLLQDTIGAQIRELEGRMKKEHEADPSVQLLRTVPGLGPILSAVVATEIDGIERFNRADKLCAYAGLVPTTYASGGHTYHGRLLPFCNRWLRWAFVEASWTAIARSAYFGSIYQRHRARGKKANTAIMAVARRMCQISWTMLRERRNYHKVPSAKTPSPVAPAPI